MPDTEIKEQPLEFSLVRGGPLYRFFRWARLSGSELEMVGRRMVAVTVITWLPLLVLSVLDGTVFKGKVESSFFLDAAVHTRFLIGLPLLFYGEWFSHRSLGPGMQNLLRRQIVHGDDVPKFYELIDRAHRLRNSVWLELGIAIVVCTVGAWVWRNQMIFGAPSWAANPDGVNLNLTLPGYWLAFVSVPIFQFILVRWYARFLIWFWLLWRLSRFNLDLIVTHPDRAGGIDFLVRMTYSFGFLLAVQGVLLSGLIANLILHNGRHLMEFKEQAAGYIIFFVLMAIAPLAAFIPAMVAAKRTGLSTYGLLASQYTSSFGKKWIEDGDSSKDEELLGSSDIQSLADLGGSFQMVREMRLCPFGLRAVANLAIITALPLVPLLLFVFSLADLFDKMIKVVF